MVCTQMQSNSKALVPIAFDLSASVIGRYLQGLLFHVCLFMSGTLIPASLASGPGHRRGHSWGSDVIEPLARGGFSSLPVSWMPRLSERQSQWLQSLLEKVKFFLTCLHEYLGIMAALLTSLSAHGQE